MTTVLNEVTGSVSKNSQYLSFLTRVTLVKQDPIAKTSEVLLQAFYITNTPSWTFQGTLSIRHIFINGVLNGFDSIYVDANPWNQWNAVEVLNKTVILQHDDNGIYRSGDTLDKRRLYTAFTTDFGANTYGPGATYCMGGGDNQPYFSEIPDIDVSPVTLDVDVTPLETSANIDINVSDSIDELSYKINDGEYITIDSSLRSFTVSNLIDNTNYNLTVRVRRSYNHIYTEETVNFTTLKSISGVIKINNVDCETIKIDSEELKLIKLNDVEFWSKS